MTRLSKLPVQDWDSDLRALTHADNATPLEQGMTRVLAHSPEVAKAVIRFGGALFQSTRLPRRLIELVRLRIAFHNQCRSCMAIRYQSAIDDGLTEGMVCSLEKPLDAPDLTDAEKAALAYADMSSTDHFSIDDRTFSNLRRFFGEAEIVELGAFIGFNIGYHTFFGTLKFYPMFSPDGRLVSQEESARLYGAAPASLQATESA